MPAASMVALGNERIKEWKSPATFLVTFSLARKSNSQELLKAAAKEFIR
jgi:hypothetical protein